MKYLLYTIIFLAVIGALYFGFFTKNQLLQNSKQEESVRQVANWETKTDSQSPITITVTPIELNKNASLWKFQVVLDTHSGSLDDDLRTKASLVDDKGNIYQPLAWEGADPGGHHREGALVFEAIKSPLLYLELQIKDIGGIPKRSFKWSIQ
jgi:hypothetical protein